MSGIQTKFLIFLFLDESTHSEGHFSGGGVHQPEKDMTTNIGVN